MNWLKKLLAIFGIEFKVTIEPEEPEEIKVVEEYTDLKEAEYNELRIRKQTLNNGTETFFVEKYKKSFGNTLVASGRFDGQYVRKMGSWSHMDFDWFNLPPAKKIEVTEYSHVSGYETSNGEIEQISLNPYKKTMNEAIFPSLEEAVKFADAVLGNRVKSQEYFKVEGYPPQILPQLLTNDVKE